MTMKFHQVTDFAAFGLDATERELMMFPSGSLSGPVSIQLYTSETSLGTGSQLVKMQQTSNYTTYTDIAALTAAVSGSAVVLKAGNVGGRQARLVGSGRGMVFVWITRQAMSDQGLEMRTR